MGIAVNVARSICREKLRIDQFLHLKAGVRRQGEGMRWTSLSPLEVKVKKTLWST
jgi:hypothetical protein